MDYFVKLLFVSGKFLTKVAGKTILEVYYKSSDLQNHLATKYNKATQLTGNYENMLELINKRIQEIGINDGKLIASNLDDVLSDVNRSKTNDSHELVEVEILKPVENDYIFREFFSDNFNISKNITDNPNLIKASQQNRTIDVVQKYSNDVKSNTSETNQKKSVREILEEPFLVRSKNVNKAEQDFSKQNLNYEEKLIDDEFEICRLIMAKKRVETEKQKELFSQDEEVCQQMIFVPYKEKPLILSKYTAKDLIPVIENRIKAEMDKREEVNLLNKVSGKC